MISQLGKIANAGVYMYMLATGALYSCLFASQKQAWYYASMVSCNFSCSVFRRLHLTWRGLLQITQRTDFDSFALLVLLRIMACFRSAELKNQEKVSKAIDEELRLSFRKRHLTIVGGSKGAGKTTFMRLLQMIDGRSMFGGGEDERKAWKRRAARAIVEAMSDLLQGMLMLKIDFAKEESTSNAEALSKIDLISLRSLTDEHRTILKSLWSDPAVRQCFDRHDEFTLSTPSVHFLKNLDTVCEADYSPSDEDLIHLADCLVNVGSVEECSVEIDKRLFLVADISKVRPSRKWISYFEDACAVLYMLSIVEYDEVVLGSEQEGTTRLQESLDLLRMICSMPWLRYAMFHVVFTKRDLLEAKLQQSDFVDHFPAFDGPRQDAMAVETFLRKRVSELCSDHDDLYIHCVDVTKIEDVRKVFFCMKDTIFQYGLPRRIDL